MDLSGLVGGYGCRRLRAGVQCLDLHVRQGLSVSITNAEAHHSRLQVDRRSRFATGDNDKSVRCWIVQEHAILVLRGSNEALVGPGGQQDVEPSLIIDVALEAANLEAPGRSSSGLEAR